MINHDITLYVFTVTGLCPFIYEKHYANFLDFLKKQGIAIDNGTLSSRHSFPRNYT